MSKTNQPTIKIYLAFFRWLRLFLICCMTVLFVGTVPGQIPETMHFQGTLLDPETGLAQDDGNYEILFQLYDRETSGTAIWSETHSSVAVLRGNFSVLLGSAGSPLNVPFDEPYWLELTVESELLSPRIPLVSSPYAFRAITAENIDGNSFDDGDENLFIGVGAGASLTTGASNAFYGYQAGAAVTSGSSNVLFGSSAGTSLTSGSQNTILGHDAGSSNEDGTNNVVIGQGAGSGNVNGSGNIFIGAGSGASEMGSNKLYIENSTSTSPLIYGEFDAGQVRVNGSLDVTGAITGDGSSLTGITVDGNNFDDGSGNVLIGLDAGANLTTGASNIFIGNAAGTINSVGDQNTFVGWEAGTANTSGLNNVFVGYSAGSTNSTASNSTFIGASAGVSSTGSNNTFVGSSSGESNTSGGSNAFFGRNSGVSNSTGNFNTFLGTQAGAQNTSGSDNTFIGNSAGSSNMSGTSNIFIGSSSGTSHMTGNNNIFIGISSGQSNSSGTSNIILGSAAGASNEDGNNNVFIGNSAGENNANGSDNVFIGFAAGTNELGSNKLYIENSLSSKPLIYGEFDTDRVGINRVSTSNTLEVGGDASKIVAGDWLANSDRRIKRDIMDIENSLELVKSLRPVKFRYTKEWMEQNPTLKNHYYYNFIAQEYQEVFPESVKGSGEYLAGDDKELLQIDSYNAQVVTIKAVQELIEKVTQLEQRNAHLASQNTQLFEALQEMRKRIERVESKGNLIAEKKDSE